MKPSVGRIVHYVSYGTPGGEYGRECRAAVVTEAGVTSKVGLCVLNPTGQFFNRDVDHDPGDTEGESGDRAMCDGVVRRGGTWHWPAKV